MLVAALSGGLGTAEAMRAISQASALAEADGLRLALCDLRAVDRGPSGTMLVATGLATGFRAGLRVAFAARAEQAPFLQRIIRQSRIRRGIRVFESPEEAEGWLLQAAKPTRRAGSTEARHAAQLLAADRRGHTWNHGKPASRPAWPDRRGGG